MDRRNGLSRAIAGIVFVALAVCDGNAGDVFVNNELGDDLNSGAYPVQRGESEGPVRTFQAAVKRLPTGGRIVFLPTGTPYTDSVAIDGRLTQSDKNSPLVIEGNGVEFLGTAPTDSLEWRLLDDEVYQLNRPEQFHNVLFVDGKAARRASAPMFGPRPTPEPGEYALWRGQLLFRVAKGKTINDYKLECGERDCAVFINRAKHVVLKNCRFRGYALDAVQIRGPVGNIRIERCEFADNGRCGLASYTDATVSVSESFFTTNEAAGVIAQNHSKTILNSCVVQQNPAAVVADDRSTIERSGDVPQPLQDGPFYLPVVVQRSSKSDMPDPSEPLEPEVVEPPAKKSSTRFFD